MALKEWERKTYHLSNNIVEFPNYYTKGLIPMEKKLEKLKK